MIELRDEQGIAVVELAHGKANALDLELCRELISILGGLARERARALVLTGRGGIFSAGVDLKRLIEGGTAYAREFVPALSAVFRELFTFPAPVVAAVNGHAVAGGCILACSADRLLIVDTAVRVGVPELRVGVPFPASAIEIMRATLDPTRFRSLILGGTTLDPVAARDWGLVDAIVPSDRLLAEALTVARELAAVPADVFRVTKQQMRLPVLQRIEAAEREHGDEVLRLWLEPSTLESVRAWVDQTLRRR